MARTRTVKPEFWDDQKLCSISRDARLTFIGLWTNSDDYGVVKGHHVWLKSQIYPYDEIKIQSFSGWLKELEDIGVIFPFLDNGENYYYIKHFTKHQFINRPSKAKNPSPPQKIIEDSMNTHGVLIDETETETETETYPVPLKSKNGNIPYQEIADAYNSILGDFLANCKSIEGDRKKLIKMRWHTDEKTSTLEWWRDEFFPFIAESDFLTGRSGKWTSCNLDWILKASNFRKIREGTYNR